MLCWSGVLFESLRHFQGLSWEVSGVSAALTAVMSFWAFGRPQSGLHCTMLSHPDLDSVCLQVEKKKNKCFQLSGILFSDEFISKDKITCCKFFVLFWGCILSFRARIFSTSDLKHEEKLRLVLKKHQFVPLIESISFIWSWDWIRLAPPKA